MKTVFALMAQYDGKAAIPAEVVCADFFAPLTFPVFLRKIGAGEIALPVARMDKSQKASRMVALSDLADYLDERRAEAKAELRKMRA